tara:strand:- start:1143 stop:1358 length:216 start_codon:yes stop_codon:yes gene_type:complete
MTTGLFIFLFSADPVLAQDCDDLKRDMIALELFLQDKKDHKEFCPKISWEQPTIDVYKKELKTQLPKGCKK